MHQPLYDRFAVDREQARLSQNDSGRFGNCGKQICAPAKPRHKAAVIHCFVTHCGCPRLLWRRLWTSWWYVAEGHGWRGFQAAGQLLISVDLVYPRPECQLLYPPLQAALFKDVSLWITLWASFGKNPVGGIVAGLPPLFRRSALLPWFKGCLRGQLKYFR